MTEQLKITPNGYSKDKFGNRWATLGSREAQKTNLGIRPRMLPLLADAGLIAKTEGIRTKKSEPEILLRISDLAKHLHFGTPTVTMLTTKGEVAPALINNEQWLDTGSIIAKVYQKHGKGVQPTWDLAQHELANNIEDYIEDGAISWGLGRYAEIVKEYRYGPRWDDYNPEETRRYSHTLGKLAILIPESEALDLSEILADEY